MAMSIDEKYQDEVEKLLEVGKEKEFLTYDDINELLPPDVNSADDIEALFEKISAEGISIGESDDKFMSTDSDKKLDEPVERLLNQGMVGMQTYRCPDHEWLFPEEVGDDGKCLMCSQPVAVGRVEKMSKSKKNVVDPDRMIDIYGADSLRVFELFAGPPDKDMEWTGSGIEGASKYLQRVWRIAYKWHARLAQGTASAGIPGQLGDHQRKLRRRTHQIIRAITENFEERLHLNTCISSLMELTNEIIDFDRAVEAAGGPSPADLSLAREAFDALITMLAPFAPHIAEEIWEGFGHTQGLSHSQWPEYSRELAREDRIEIAVQVNGKLRSRIYVNQAASQEEMREAALQDDKVKALTAQHQVARVIVVPGKLVNVVVK